MPYLAAAKREYLVRPLTLLVLLVVIIVVLLLLFPRKDLLQDVAMSVAPEEMTLGNIQSLLKIHPEDASLRLLLVKRQIEEGHFDSALENITPLLDYNSPSSDQAKVLTIELKLKKMMGQKPGDPQRRQYLDALARQFGLDPEIPKADKLPNPVPPAMAPPTPKSGQSSRVSPAIQLEGMLEQPDTVTKKQDEERPAKSGQPMYSSLNFFNFIGEANAADTVDKQGKGLTVSGQHPGLEMRLANRISRDTSARTESVVRRARYQDTKLKLRLTYYIRAAKTRDAENLHLAVLLKQDKEVIEALPRIAKQVLALERPGTAAAIYEQLALVDPGHNVKWFVEAARWHLAAELPLQAGRNYAEASAASASPELASRYALASLKAMIAANSGEGLGLARQFVRRFPSNAAILDKAVTFAIAQGKLNLARKWGKKLVLLEPQNRAAHKRLAEVAEWSGHPGLALKHWKWLARRQPDIKTIDHALGLAIGLFDSKAALEMLELKRRKGMLTEQELKELASVYERLGDPEQAEAAFRNYIRRFPEREEGWKQLAVLQEQKGDLRSALLTWGGIEKRFGAKKEYTAKRAELLWRLQESEKALLALRKVRQQAASSDVSYWSLYGELAWSLEENEEAIAAYRQLWSGKGASPLVAERLIILARDTGQIDEVVAVGESAWKRYQSARLFMMAMDAAVNAGHWKDVARMVKVAQQNEVFFRSFANYWLIRGQLAVYLGRKRDAIVIYEQALKHYPDNTGLRVSLLWLLIEVDDRKRLPLYLGFWTKDAALDPAYWSAYAAGYFQIEHVKKSLPWYARYARAHPGDYLWLLGYADALQKAGLQSSAWRMRRYALIKLRPQVLAERSRGGKPDGKFLRAYALLTRELRGLPRGEAWAESILKLSKDDPLARDFAIFWYLNDERFPYARHWVMKQHAERQKIPAWKRMLIALDDNDLEKVARILEEPESLTTISRMFATRTLSRDDRGLELAMDNDIGAGFTGERETTLLRNIRNAYNRTPNALHTGVSSERLGKLGLDSYSVKYYRTRNNQGLELRLSRIELRENAGNLFLQGRDLERDLEIAGRWQDRRGITRLGLGVNQRGDFNLTRFNLLRTYEFSGRTSGQLKLLVNDLGKETSSLRATGARHRLSASLYTNLSLRNFASLELGLNRYHSRAGNALASGYSVDLLLGHRLMLTNSLAETQWQVWGQATINRNSLEAGLPAEVALMLPQGSTVASVVPPEFYLLGIGTGLQRGIPGSPEGIARTLSYRIEAWLGFQWPNTSLSPAYSLRVGIGAPIFGRDRLSLDAFYTTTSLGGNGSEPFKGIELWYSWRFGR